MHLDSWLYIYLFSLVVGGIYFVAYQCARRIHNPFCKGLAGHMGRLPGTMGLVLFIALSCNVAEGRKRWKATVDYVMGRNRLLMLAFFFFTGGEEIVFFYATWSYFRYPAEKVFFVLICASVWITYFMGVLSNPGIVLPAKELADWKQRARNKSSRKEKYDAVAASRVLQWDRAGNAQFQADGLIYRSAERNICETCEVPRPPRSKHCRLCGHCVRRYDHHCYWLNNDVGGGNYVYFLLFLYDVWVTSACVASQCVLCLLRIIWEQNLWNATFVNRRGDHIASNMTTVARYLLSKQTYIVLAGFFGLAVAVMLFVFWAVHMWQTAWNQTTNDKDKSGQLEDYLWYCWDCRGRIREKNAEAFQKKSTAVPNNFRAPDPTPFSEPEAIHRIVWSLVKCETKKEAKGKIGAVMRRTRTAYHRGLVANFAEVLFDPSEK